MWCGAAASPWAHLLRDVFSFVLDYVGEEGTAESVGLVSRQWSSSAACHPCAFRRPVARHWEAAEASYLAAYQRLERRLRRRAGEDYRAIDFEAELHAHSLSDSFKEFLSQWFSVEFICKWLLMASEVLSEVYFELLPRAKQAVLFSARVARRLDAAASAEYFYGALQESEEARLRVDLLCEVMQTLRGRLLRLSWLAYEWAAPLTAMASAAIRRGHGSSLTEQDVQALPQSVGAGLRSSADRARELLSCLLPMGIFLRTHALQVRGVDVALDPVVSLLELQLAEVEASAGCQEPAREEAATGPE